MLSQPLVAALLLQAFSTQLNCCISCHNILTPYSLPSPHLLFADYSFKELALAVLLLANKHAKSNILEICNSKTFGVLECFILEYFTDLSLSSARQVSVVPMSHLS